MNDNDIVEFVNITRKGNEEKMHSLREYYAQLFTIEEHISQLRKMLELYGSGPLSTPNISVKELEDFLVELMNSTKKNIVNRLNEINIRTDDGYAIDIYVE